MNLMETITNHCLYSIAGMLFGADVVVPIFEGDDASDYVELEFFQVGDLKISVDEHIQALVPYRGDQGSFNYISVADILNGSAKKSALKD